MKNITVEVIAQYIDEIKEKLDPRSFTDAVQTIAELYDFTPAQYIQLLSLVS